MTLEEAITNFNIIREAVEDYVCNYLTDTAKAQKILNALQDMEQQSSDTVSRRAYEQVMWERDVAIRQLKELGYGLGQKIEHTEQWQELKETITELRDNNGTGTQQEVCKFLVNYMDILEKQIIKAPLKEVHKSKILCPICEYKDSPFMPCNACDDLGSEFKEGDKE